MKISNVTSGMPTASVCVITYNHQQFIRQAIESIVGQEAPFKIEIVIGEDFSTDSTRAICEEYSIKHPGLIRLLPSIKNLGVTVNFGRTLLECTGKYIALCEGDDYWTDPNKLTKQVEFLEQNDEFVACYHPVKVVDSNGALIRNTKSSFLHNRDLSQGELIQGRVMSLVSLCFRNIIKEFPEEFYKSPSGDNFLCSLLGNYGKGKYLPTIEPSAYRMHSGGIWSLKNDSEKKMNLLLSYFLLWQYYARLGKREYVLGFYTKIIREGFYSNPIQGNHSKFLGTAEFVVIRLIRRFFRLLRKVFPRPAKAAASQDLIQDDEQE